MSTMHATRIQDATCAKADPSRRRLTTTHSVRSGLVVIAGTLGLVVASAAPAFALGGANHTEPVTDR